MTTPRVPSAEELMQRLYIDWYGPKWEITEPSGRLQIFDELVVAIRARDSAVLEAAAEITCPDPISLPGTPNPRGLVCVGYRQAWLDYRAKIRALKEDL